MISSMLPDACLLPDQGRHPRLSCPPLPAPLLPLHQAISFLRNQGQGGGEGRGKQQAYLIYLALLCLAWKHLWLRNQKFLLTALRS